MPDRIDIGKLRGVYYNYDKEPLSNAASLSDMKINVSIDDDVFVDNNSETFNDIEDMIVEHIKNMPVAEYNDLSNKDSKTLAGIETYANLVNIVAKFMNITSLSTIVMTYCDYFGLKYDKVILELPNGLKIKLYNELKKYTKTPEILDNLFGFNTTTSKPLF